MRGIFSPKSLAELRERYSSPQRNIDDREATADSRPSIGFIRHPTREEMLENRKRL